MSESQVEEPRLPVDAVKVTVTFHHRFYDEDPLLISQAIPPTHIEMVTRETNLISEIKLQAIEALGYNTTTQRKDGEWVLRIQDFVLDDTTTLQEIMRDVIGHATVEALLARVGTIPMRLEYRKKKLLIATH